MVRIEVSEEADWTLFEDVARILEQGLGQAEVVQKQKSKVPTRVGAIQMSA